MKNIFFLSLLDLFAHFLLNASIGIIWTFSEKESLVIVLKYNIIVFVILFICIFLIYYSKKINDALLDYQFSFLTSIRILMILANFQIDFELQFFEKTLAFWSGSFFFYLLRPLFQKKNQPLFNHIVILLLGLYFLLFFVISIDFAILIRFIMVLSFEIFYYLRDYIIHRKDKKLKAKFKGASHFEFGILSLDADSKKIININSYFEEIVGPSTSDNMSLEKYGHNFNSFKVNDLKKSSKYFLKLHGNAAKPYEIFQKNISCFESQALKFSKQHNNEDNTLNLEDSEIFPINILDKIKEEITKESFKKKEKNKSTNIPKKEKTQSIKKTQINIAKKKNSYEQFSTRLTKQLKLVKVKIQMILKKIFKTRESNSKTKKNNFNINNNITNKSYYDLLSSFLISKNGTDLIFKLSLYRNKTGNLIYFTLAQLHLEEFKEILNETQIIVGGIVSSISHELRTPLNCSLNLLEILAHHIDEDIFQNYLNPILLSTKNLKFVINDLIDYSLLISEKFKLSYSCFDLKKALLDVMEIVSITLGHKSIDLDFVYDEDVPKMIKSDPNRIKQVLLNLLGLFIFLTVKI